MQQPEYYSYLLDNNNNNDDNEYYTNDQLSGPSQQSTQQQQQQQQQQEQLLKGGIDFRRRKNWSERILIEITGLLHVLSPRGKILYCSESTFELTGYKPHELVGQSLMDFIHVDDMDTFIRDFRASFFTKSQIKTYYRFHKKDESFVLFEVIGQPKSDTPDQQSFFGIAQPMPTKSGSLIDTFLELKMENNFLQKRIQELSLRYGISSPKPTKNRIPEDWLENTNPSDLEDDAERKDKSKRRKKNKGTDEYVCTDCGTTSSPEWRKGPHGPKTLCNACGLRWAKKNKRQDMNED